MIGDHGGGSIPGSGVRWHGLCGAPSDVECIGAARSVVPEGALAVLHLLPQRFKLLGCLLAALQGLGDYLVCVVQLLHDGPLSGNVLLHYGLWADMEEGRESER